MADEIVERDSRMCQATNRKGEPCGRYAVADRKVCYMHGGASPRGVQASNFIHGRYSKALPIRLWATYQDMRKDPALLSLQEENALMLTRINDLLGKVDTGEAGETWASLNKIFNKLMKASENGEQYEVAMALSELGEAITKGYDDYRAWAAVLDAVERRRKLVDTERRLNLDMGRSISADRALIWIGSIMDSVIRNVSENVEPGLAKKIIGGISDDLQRLLNYDGKEVG